MKLIRKWIPCVAVILLLVAACGPPAGEETAVGTATPTRTRAPKGPCGDGTCDEVEQANPGLCPEDCGAPDDTAATDTPTPRSTPTTAPTPTGEVGGGVGPGPDESGADEPEPEPPEETEPEPPEETEPEPDEGTEPQCEPSQWTLAIEARATLVRTEPSADLFAAIIGNFVVEESCKIQGTAAGQYIEETCAYESVTGLCSYDIQCPGFTADITGLAVPGPGITDTFIIKLDGSSILETGTGHCGEASVPFERGGVLQDALGSAHRNGHGNLVEVAVPAQGEPDSRSITSPLQDVDAIVPSNLSYVFHMHFFRGKQPVEFDDLWFDWEYRHAEWDPMGESQGEQ
jgi:hypothetical protein